MLIINAMLIIIVSYYNIRNICHERITCEITKYFVVCIFNVDYNPKYLHTLTLFIAINILPQCKWLQQETDLQYCRNKSVIRVPVWLFTDTDPFFCLLMPTR